MAKTFAWHDYFLFIFMLVVSAVIGAYYGFIKQQKTANDYLLGGKKMKIWPTAMSIVSSQLSALILISLPANTYRFGIGFWLTVPFMVFVSLTAYYIYLPVFYKLEVTSIYEYLNLRFNNKVRRFGSVLYTIDMILYTPIMIYVPALAFRQVTGVSIHYITPIVCGVCIFYTTLGGLRAMVKADSIQFGIMLTTFIIVIILGVISVGGFETIFRRSYEKGRLSVSFDFDMTKRDTFWSCTIDPTYENHKWGGYYHNTLTTCLTTTLLLIRIGEQQVMLSAQKFTSRLRTACTSTSLIPVFISTLILASIGVVVVKTVCMGAGLVIFAKYSDCDPFETRTIKNLDDLLPMYVMDTVSFIPGFAGLFLSGIFGAGLSGLSAALNCLAATVYQDFISPFVPKETPQERISLYLKSLVLIIGIFTTTGVFIVEKLDGLLALTLSFAAIAGGALTGLFSVGMLIPFVNAKGALCGGIASLIVNAWLVLGGLWYKMKGFTDPKLPVSTNGCNETLSNQFNETLVKFLNTNLTNTVLEEDQPFVLYRISFYWFVMIGVLTVFVVSILISCFTKDDKPLNRACICPIGQMLLKKEDKPPKYDTIEKALRVVNED